MTEKIYTCPMHPEIQEPKPGSCPICGMALEAERITLEDQPSENLELKDFRRRFWIGLVLTLPVIFLEMGSFIIDLGHWIPANLSVWIQLILATPVVLYSGFPFFERAWISVKNRALNMFSLVSMGTGIALLYSYVATIFPMIFPESFRNNEGVVAVYFEAASVIIVLVLLGQVLELKAREKTSGAIKALLGLAPKMAHRITKNGKEEEIPIEHIHIGRHCC